MSAMADAPDRLVPLKEASELLGVSVNTIRLWLTKGEITRYRKRLDNRIYVSLTEIESLRNQPPQPEPND